MRKTFLVVVGEDETEFTVHTDVASRSSKFFRAALSSGWKESLQNHVTLKNITSINFGYYLQWLSTNDHKFLVELSLLTFVQLYILGDFLDDSAFRTCLLNHFVKKAVDILICPGGAVVTAAWEQTPRDSPLRKVIVEIWITASKNELVTRFAGVHKDVPKEFIVDCLQRIGDTHARAREDMSPEDRKRAIERRRDEGLKEFDV